MPTAPPAVTSAYLAFSKKNRDIIKKTLPDNAAGSVIMKAVGAAWKALSPADKAPYNKMRIDYLISIGRRPKGMASATRGLPPGWVVVTVDNKKTYNHIASNVCTTKKPCIIGSVKTKSKRNLSAYSIYVKENFVKCGKSMKQCGETWKLLSDAKKQEYSDKSAVMKLQATAGEA